MAPALTIAMLGAIESLLSATVADRLGGDKHNSNVELFGQGIANIVSPLFGGLPATGAIARTATNIRSGAKTPIAGIVHALTILAVLVWAAPLAKVIPLCVLAAILMVVSYNMGEWREIPDLLKLTKSDITVWLVTFAMTVFADLTVAVEAGMILAALLYIQKVSRTTTVSRVTTEYIDSNACTFCRTIRFPITPPFPHSRPLPVRRHRQAGGSDAANRSASSRGTAAAAKHDRHRRDGAAGSRRSCRCAEEIRPLPDSLRGQGTACQIMRDAEFERHVGLENICPHITSALQRARDIHREQNALSQRP